MKRRLVIKVMVSLLSVLAIAGIGSGCEKQADLIGTINEAGSTTVQPLAQKLAEEFMNQHPNVNIIISGGGSGEGISKMAAGSVDLGASSRDLTSADPQLVTHLIGHDGIAIIIHPSNKVGNLTMDQAAKVFSGVIKDWSELGGTPGPIILISREEGSGTRTYFEQTVMGTSKISPDVISEPSNGDIIAKVSTTPSSIGYLSIGYLDNSVKAVALNGVAATLENCKSNKYPIVRPLYFLTASEPQGIVKAFIDFCESVDGQKIVTNEGFLGKN